MRGLGWKGTRRNETLAGKHSPSAFVRIYAQSNSESPQVVKGFLRRLVDPPSVNLLLSNPVMDLAQCFVHLRAKEFCYWKIHCGLCQIRGPTAFIPSLRTTISPPSFASLRVSQNPTKSDFSKGQVIAFCWTCWSSQESVTNLPCLLPSGRPYAALPDRSCWPGSCQT